MYSVSWETSLRGSSASARQLPPRPSVSLVLAVFGPPSAHGCYHNAVHVEPGLTQGRCVGLAQTTLQHVEKGLTHNLKKPKTNRQRGGKKHVFSPYVYKKYVWMSEKLHYVDHTANDCGLTPTAWCFRPRLSKKSSREWRSSRWLTAASITSITWNHRSMLSTDQSCDRSRGGAHLGHMFQELRAREAVLCGATVCSVVEKAEELRVQLKQSATDKNHTVPQMYTHGTCCWTATRKLNL